MTFLGPKLMVLTIMIGIWMADLAARAQGALEGPYWGYLLIDGQDSKVPLRFDVVRAHSGRLPGQEDLYAFLKLQMGGYGGHEYLVQSYRVEGYDFSHPEIALNAMLKADFGPGISIVEGVFSQSGTRLDASFSSPHAGLVGGKIKLLHFSHPHLEEELENCFADLPEISAVTGEYRGRCDGNSAELVIMAGKTQNGGLIPNHSLRGYQIQGRYKTVEMGRTGRYRSIVKAVNGIQYDFYRSRIELPGISYRTHSCICDINNDGIYCHEQCSFRRVGADESKLASMISSEAALLRAAKLGGSVAVAAAEPRAVASTLSTDYIGQYFGLVEMQVREGIQAMDLRVEGYGQALANGQQPNIGASLNIYYNGTTYGQGSFVNVLFEELDVSTLKRLPAVWKSKGDVLLLVQSWQDGEIRGGFYSTHYGYVGDFNFAIKSLQNAQEDLAAAGDLISGPTYRFRGGSKDQEFVQDIQLDINVSPAAVLGPSIVTPYHVGGSLHQKYYYQNFGGVGPYFYHQIKEGSFDPFVGAVYLNLESGMLLGFLQPDQKLKALVFDKVAVPSWDYTQLRTWQLR